MMNRRTLVVTRIVLLGIGVALLALALRGSSVGEVLGRRAVKEGVIQEAVVSSVVIRRAERITIRVPRCAEDASILVGRGDFSDGRWSRYVCVHRDAIR